MTSRAVGGVKGSHIAALDGLRGLAVVTILLYHSTFVSFAGHGRFLLFLGSICESGWMAVDVFFALSGFLITGILLDTRHDPGYFRKFYTRRALRIFPLYYGLILVLLALTPLVPFDWHGTAGPYLLYVQNFFEVGSRAISVSNRPWEAAPHLDHLWSLAVEEQFYLVWPAAIWLSRGMRHPWILPITLVVACPVARCWAVWAGIDRHHIYVMTPFRLDALAWGAIAAIVYRSKPKLLHRTVWLWGGLIACLTGLVWIAVRGGGALLQADAAVVCVGYSLLGIGSAALLLILSGGGLSYIFSFVWLRWMGKLSYGIYVFHVVFVPWYMPLRMWVDHHTHMVALGVLTQIAETFGVGIGCAWLSFHFYERHWLLLKDKLAAYQVSNSTLPMTPDSVLE